jgi:hypothetical protein
MPRGGYPRSEILNILSHLIDKIGKVINKSFTTEG